jgi:uncharacterized membrane protein YdjX (TVP38/TMEM64 family)
MVELILTIIGFFGCITSGLVLSLLAGIYKERYLDWAKDYGDNVFKVLAVLSYIAAFIPMLNFIMFFGSVFVIGGIFIFGKVHSLVSYLGESIQIKSKDE